MLIHIEGKYRMSLTQCVLVHSSLFITGIHTYKEQAGPGSSVGCSSTWHKLTMHSRLFRQTGKRKYKIAAENSFNCIIFIKLHVLSNIWYVYKKHPICKLQTSKTFLNCACIFFHQYNVRSYNYMLHAFGCLKIEMLAT